MKLVTVKVEGLPLRKYVFKYAILCDRSIQQIKKYAEDNLSIFVFPFYTCAPSEIDKAVENWLTFPASGEAYMRVLQPTYVGHFKPTVLAINQIVDFNIGEGRRECVLDESLLVDQL